MKKSAGSGIPELAEFLITRRTPGPDVKIRVVMKTNEVASRTKRCIGGMLAGCCTGRLRNGEDGPRYRSQADGWSWIVQLGVARIPSLLDQAEQARERGAVWNRNAGVEGQGCAGGSTAQDSL